VRPSGPAVEHYIEDRISEAVLSGKFKGKNLIKINVQDEEQLKFEGEEPTILLTNRQRTSRTCIGPPDCDYMFSPSRFPTPLLRGTNLAAQRTGRAQSRAAINARSAASGNSIGANMDAG
jgi:hypothetical protein